MVLSTCNMPRLNWESPLYRNIIVGVTLCATLTAPAFAQNDEYLPVDDWQKTFEHFHYSADLSLYKWGILAAIIAIFLGADLLANHLKPLAKTQRWTPTIWIGVLAGVGYSVLDNNYQWDKGNTQKNIDLTYHPLATGIGAILPALIFTLLIWYFVRRRILKKQISVEGGGNLTQSFVGPDSSRSYRTAGSELLEDRCDPETWARALEEGKGDDGVTRAAYIRLRVANLQRVGS